MQINNFTETKDFKAIGNIVASFIKEFEASDIKKRMTEGVAYYNQKNTKIIERKKQYYNQNGVLCNDPYKSNHKLPSGYMKLLVKQKVNYSINNKMTLSSKKVNIDQLELYLGNWKKALKKLASNTSQKSVGYWQIYLNNEGKFDYKELPSEQCIPVFSEDDDTLLNYFIRYYQTNIIGTNGKSKSVVKVEFWTSNEVYYFIKDKGNFVPAPDEPVNPKPHILTTVKYGENVADIKGNSWERPPFVVLYNNDEKHNDLQPIKAFIDIFDIVNSDFANNLDDIQDVYWILKNYNGEDVEEFLENVKKYKALKVGEGGDAKAETIQIPVEAREKMLALTEKQIYKYGMGVNPDDVEGNITNVRIKSLYSMLDLKANDFEQEIRDFMYQLFYFLNRYYQINGGTGINPMDIDVTFNRALIVNEAELLNANASQVELVPEKIRLENHPWITDVDEALQLMQEDKMNNPFNSNGFNNKNNNDDEV